MNMINLSSFDYHLPKELIAQYPAEKRRLSKLLVLDRDKKTIQHRKFTDLIDFLTEGDCLVLNNTYVIPARLKAERESTGAKLEVFLIRKIQPFIYQVLIKPSKRAKVEDQIVIGRNKIKAKIIEDNPPEKRLKFDKIEDLDRLLEEEGSVPLPPYIKRIPEELDKDRYQTVFAKNKGAIAAPTAGLHFDKDYLGQIEQKSIKICYLTLHISYGTFKPITEQDLEKGKLFSEYYRIDTNTIDTLNKVKTQNKRIIAVGTTSCRALESAAKNEKIHPVESWTELFIYPPYKFKFTDCLLTNFHLPKSSLLMLVSAFCSNRGNLTIDEGHRFLMEAYKQAIDKKYRFYSYGDVMLIL